MCTMYCPAQLALNGSCGDDNQVGGMRPLILLCPLACRPGLHPQDTGILCMHCSRTSVHAVPCCTPLLLLPHNRTRHEHGAHPEHHPSRQRGSVTVAAGCQGSSSRGRGLDAWLQGVYTQARQPHYVEDLCQSHLQHDSEHHEAVTERVSAATAGAASTQAAVSSSSGVQQQEQVNDNISLQEAKNPTRLDFDSMYSQLAQWAAEHISCHVPRNCFDAPPLLGAWVRHMRRLYLAGKLAHWQVERLNLLGFEWHLDDATAKWLNMYHLLRRHKAMHGHTSVDASSEMLLARWLADQGPQLAAGKLSERQQQMLSLAGVQLTVPQQQVEQLVQLQGLNAHERKLLRRKFKNSSQARKVQ